MNTKKNLQEILNLYRNTTKELAQLIKAISKDIKPFIQVHSIEQQKKNNKKVYAPYEYTDNNLTIRILESGTVNVYYYNRQFTDEFIAIGQKKSNTTYMTLDDIIIVAKKLPEIMEVVIKEYLLLYKNKLNESIKELSLDIMEVNL